MRSEEDPQPPSLTAPAAAGAPYPQDRPTVEMELLGTEINAV